MSTSHVVVDGSNLATEGRTLPSLTQLEEAVRSYAEEHPDVEIVVVVDATFEHRVEDPKERERLKEAELHGEVVSPPAGAIGRGDAFVLKIAQRTGAVVLSNDSFQEFHGEYPWLFDEGRLVGGKPVPGVGWIFTPRTPVRGPKSRAATKAAGRTTKKRGGPPVKLPDTRPDGSAPMVGDVLTPTPLPEPASPKKIRGYELAKELGIDSKALLALAKKAKVNLASHSSSLAVEDADKLRSLATSAKKIRGYELAKELGIESKALLALAAGVGVTLSSHSSSINDVDAATIRRAALVADVAHEVEQDAAEPPSTSGRRRRRRRAGKSEVDGNESSAPAARAPRSTAKKSAASTKKTGVSSRKSTDGPKKSNRERAASGPRPVNEPLSLLGFLGEHAVGSTLEATVVSFTSHGAMVEVALDGGGSFICYVPTSRLGDPPPARARDVLPKGDVRSYRVLSVDPARRVAELEPA